MKCPLCNAEIKEGSLYCEVCGEDIHIVPTFDPVIDEACNATIEKMTQGLFDTRPLADAEKVKKVAKDNSNKPALNKPVGKDEVNPQPVPPPEKKKKPLFNLPKPYNYIVIAFAFVVIFTVTIILFIYFTSDKYKLRQADKAYQSAEYTKAAFLYEELIQKNVYDTQLLEKYSKAVYGKGDIDRYAEVLIDIFDNAYSTQEQKDNALTELISIYDEKNDFEKIQEIVLATQDSEIITKYSIYFTDPPEIATKSGTYDLPQLLVINNEDKNNKIYYTVKCTKNGVENIICEDEEYTGSVLLDEGLFDITAYSVNPKGVRSEEVKCSLEIVILPPSAPVISPESGIYLDSETIEIQNYTEGNVLFYFTTDGTTPTEKSDQYTGPLVMLPGETVYKFICIDDKGLASEVTEVKYNFDIQYNISPEEAHGLVLDYLYNKGTTSGKDGTLEDGGSVFMMLTGIVSEDLDSASYSVSEEDEKQNSKKYKYIFEEYIYNENGKLTGLDTRYSVDLITGEVDKVE